MKNKKYIKKAICILLILGTIAPAGTAFAETPYEKCNDKEIYLEKPDVKDEDRESERYKDCYNYKVLKSIGEQSANIGDRSDKTRRHAGIPDRAGYSPFL